MLRKSFFLSLYGGVIVYLLLNLIWGNQGSLALSKIKEERLIFEENMTFLTQENMDSQIHLNQLKNDRLSITLLARKMGYIGEGEKIIYTYLGSGEYGRSYDLPLLRTLNEESRGKTRFLRILSITAGMGVFLLSLILQWGQRGIRRSL
jgi:cell division protein FtsB